MLVRWNPTRETVAVDKLFNEFWNRGNVFSPDTYGTGPAVDLKETESAFVIHAEVPGFTPEQIDLNVENGVLYLKGERQAQEQAEKGKYHVRERRTVSFQRAFVLPVQVDAEHAQAEFENGVLTLNLPKAQAALPKKINISAKS